MDPSSTPGTGKMREHELELEVARLEAELETLRGDERPTTVAARFLAMAASTVDKAMNEARREVDEFASEHGESIVRQAEADADEIRSNAAQEAAALVATERSRVADEIKSLSDVRAALEQERQALEAYHRELRRRVQELAESMVAFMTTEAPIGEEPAIEGPLVPPLEPARADPTTETGSVNVPETSTFEEAPSFEPMTDASEPIAFVDYVVEPDPDPPQAPSPSPPQPSFHDMMAAPAVADAADEPVESDTVVDDPSSPLRSGLFGRSSGEDSRRPDDIVGGLGTHMLEQASPEELAAALASDDEEDERFRSFLDGEDKADPSRDWLLRPDQR